MANNASLHRALRFFVECYPQHLLLVNGIQPCQAWAAAHRDLVLRMRPQISTGIWRNQDADALWYQPAVPELCASLPGTLESNGLMSLSAVDYRNHNFPQLLRNYLRVVEDYWTHTSVKCWTGGSRTYAQFHMKYLEGTCTGLLALKDLYFAIHGDSSKSLPLRFATFNPLFYKLCMKFHSRFLREDVDRDSDLPVKWPLYQYINSKLDAVFISIPEYDSLHQIIAGGYHFPWWLWTPPQCDIVPSREEREEFFKFLVDLILLKEMFL